ncbi:hypothetical protein LF41_647 [Lysobacter dokdonensis DS-58]|uniref:Calx-beta domain-containing protein n=1 Tax=Lysobacter dokdonensis DS-58 TaxID=1300345 RepID=A0A0A2WFU2_9GAMM|nr:hypothetical protein LF41_647 [Lysobacter dokdonensis DS-58]
MVEGDETIILKVTTSSGWPIADDTAVLTIRDDDPRPHVRGKLLTASPDPTAPCPLRAVAYGMDGPRDEPYDIFPDLGCTFDIPVAPGANLEIREPEGNYFQSTSVSRFLPTIFNDVWRDRYKVIPAPNGLVVFGSMQPAPGETLMSGQFITVKTVESYMGRAITEADYNTVGTTFYRSVYPGATLEANVEMSSQYQPWYGVLHDVNTDRSIAPVLRWSGTLIVRGGRALPEGRAGRKYKVPVQIAYVPRSNQTTGFGSINVAWRTVDGSAKSGADYVAASGNVTLTDDAPEAIVYVEVIGNDTPQSPRAFDVAITASPAYNITNANTRFTIMDDDRRLGGPGQKR